MVVPVDLTVPYPEAPIIRYGIAALPPVPEFKPVEYPAYKPEPLRIAKRIYA